MELTRIMQMYKAKLVSHSWLPCMAEVAGVVIPCMILSEFVAFSERVRLHSQVEMNQWDAYTGALSGPARNKLVTMFKL